MTPDFIECRHAGCRFGMARELSEAQLDRLAAEMLRPPLEKRGLLGGRGLITSTRVEGLGPLVIKHYKRGGWLRFWTAGRYLRMGRLRPQVEGEMMLRVRGLGVNAPEPVAFAVRGRLFYRGWLITREIEGPESLAEVSLKQEARACRLVHKLTDQVSLLIQAGLHHVDLHPGNVLVDREDQVFILDFDKAGEWKRRKNLLRDRYICRWRRAVIKHRLPEVLSEWLCAGLRRDYE